MQTAPGEQPTFKVVQVGCGNMARKWTAYAAQRADMAIVALVDIHRPAAEAMAETLGLGPEHCFTDLETAVKASGANLVFDVTIPQVHKDIVMTAAALGCDVMGEKPMAASMADAETMMRAVERHGRSYAVMQNRRYTRQIREARGLIAGGAIGRPGFATANFFLGPHFGGFREAMDNPLLLDMAIHTFDQARYLLQADPVSVYCHEFNPAHSWYDGNAAAVCVFEMSDGSVFTYNGSWCAEGAPTSWEGEWRINGSRGTLIWDGTNPPYASAIGEDEEPGRFSRELTRLDPAEPYTGREGHDGCFDEMLAALRERRRAETDCTDNIHSMAMVFGAIRSAREGRRIPLAARD
ncbi:Gfo/Idh/MocA family oxidoreductase [Paenibacillus sp. IB182496]|uniref:Gfo/Idh/MocA family oxidoreductase n=1 Tax=Paenibacillus sabuli TaxID=2772509 RepID=A0A927BX85_9BACL|nr:Gfo/Idh/MocA family oxidoreductase [Paenibacillus sabuli]MBD2848547.1 Gfo/Idh/MocA family oxidoreductase [Paenibacillus sabuli]